MGLAGNFYPLDGGYSEGIRAIPGTAPVWRPFSEYGVMIRCPSLFHGIENHALGKKVIEEPLQAANQGGKESQGKEFPVPLRKGVIVEMQTHHTADHPVDSMKGVLETDAVYLQPAGAHNGRQLFREILAHVSPGGSEILIGEDVVHQLAEIGGDRDGDASPFSQDPRELPAGEMVVLHKIGRAHV